VPGKFIAIEGIDGAGISTQAALLVAHLTENAVRCLRTREPTDRPIGAVVRQVLARRYAIPPASLALLFAADRVDHIENVVLPALADGVTVVTERHLLSSLAYQGSLLRDVAWVRAINRGASRRVEPDLTILLDVRPALSLRRIDGDARRDGREIFEEEATLRATRQAFRRQAANLRRHGRRIDIVDASVPVDAVAERVRALADALLGRSG
jgi:dTMP kinase